MPRFPKGYLLVSRDIMKPRSSTWAVDTQMKKVSILTRLPLDLRTADLKDIIVQSKVKENYFS